MKTILCIGGSDPSGGAGIQIDIPTAYSHGCLPLTAITAVTSQNSEGVYDLFLPEPQTLRLQLEVLIRDYAIDSIKIGMLGNVDNVKVVSNFIASNHIKNVVVDPVLKSSTGYNLLDNEGMLLLKETLLGHAKVVTPNIEEAEYLAQINIKDMDNMKEAARLIMDLGTGSVIVKGGHLIGEKSTDVVYDGKDFKLVEGKRIDKDLRGTGCIYATSLACNLAKGLSLEDSARKARAFVEQMLKNGSQVGNGARQITMFF